MTVAGSRANRHNRRNSQPSSPPPPLAETSVSSTRFVLNMRKAGDPTNPGTVQTGAAVFETARSADSGQGGRNPPMEGRNNSRGAAMPASAELQSKLFRPH